MRGEVYLTGLSAANRLRVNWRGQSCEFDVAMRIAARDSPGRIAPPRSCLPASAWTICLAYNLYIDYAGRIPGGQTVRAGAYADMLLLTVAF
jgi:hypothetical protein